MATLTVKQITGYSGNAIGWDGETVQAVIVADDTPSSLTIDATDVNGLGDYTKLAAGSVIITPDDDYIAFTGPAANGKTTFIKKNSSGGGGGGGGGAFIVNDEEGTLDATWQEIWDAAEAGSVMIKVSGANEIDYYVVETVITNRDDAWAVRSTDGTVYVASASSGYPMVN